MNELKNWYAVYTSHGQEKKVTESLTRKKIENFCPLTNTVTAGSNGKKLTRKPLFNSYIFVRISEVEILSLRNIDGFISVLFWLGRPAVIPETEILAIRQFLTENPSAKLEKINVDMHVIQNQLQKPLPERDQNNTDKKSESSSIMLLSMGYILSSDADSTPSGDILVEPLLQRWSRNWTQLEQKILHATQLD